MGGAASCKQVDLVAAITQGYCYAILGPSSRQVQGKARMTPTPPLRLVLPYPPYLNNLYATVGRRRVKSKEGKRYATAVAAIASERGCEPLCGPVSVVVELYRPRKQGDLDGALKALLDSLTGILWNDDSQVEYILARRFDDKANPRVEITVNSLDLGTLEGTKGE
jgi:crossover junction endodeoxyribonuclease RusA